MAGRWPEEDVRVPVARQTWRTMTFLHWRFQPEVVQRLLPEGLRVHERDGAAWVSLTPFVLADFRLGVGPAIPRLSTFPETNLRTYVVGPDGRDGIWFLDMEVASAAAAVALRSVLSLPYRVAEMEVDEAGPVRYRSTRRVSRGADSATVGHDIVIAPGAPLSGTDGDADDSLDHWLAGRWRAISRPAGQLVATPVRHEPWPLRGAEVLRLDESILAHAGLARPVEPPLVRYAPGVSVSLGAPGLVRQAASGTPST